MATHQPVGAIHESPKQVSVLHKANDVTLTVGACIARPSKSDKN